MGDETSVDGTMLSHPLSVGKVVGATGALDAAKELLVVVTV